MIGLDQQLEMEKQAIILMPDFNVCDAFRIFDNREEGRLTPHDLQNGLADIGVVVVPE